MLQQKFEGGKEFGKNVSPDTFKLYHKYNKVFLKIIAGKIKTKNVLIADYGGGNNIINIELTKMLKQRKINLKFENVDIDKQKQTKTKNVKYIQKDVLKYKAKERYDFAIARHILHYFTSKQQITFLKNVYNNLKPKGYFLLINMVNDKEFDKKIKILKICKRKIHAQTEIGIIQNIRKTKFNIVKIKRVNYLIHVNDFYKNKFKLTDDEVKYLEKNVCKKHKESQIAVLLRKD